MDADDESFLSWVRAQEGDPLGIYAQRSNAIGITQRSELRVNTYTQTSKVGRLSQRTPMATSSLIGRATIWTANDCFFVDGFAM